MISSLAFFFFPPSCPPLFALKVVRIHISGGLHKLESIASLNVYGNNHIIVVSAFRNVLLILP